FPRVGLSDLFAEPAARAIEKAGGAIESGSAVREIAMADDRATGVLVQGQMLARADAVILAVPPPAVAPLLPGRLRTEAPFTGLGQLRAAPIVSAHLWFAEPFATERMAGLLDGPIHWLFTPPMQPASGRYVTLVASGAHELASKP